MADLKSVFMAPYGNTVYEYFLHAVIVHVGL